MDHRLGDVETLLVIAYQPPPADHSAEGPFDHSLAWDHREPDLLIGPPHLKHMAATEQPAGLTKFAAEIRARMTERHLLDILKRVDHWSGYTRHFGPPSGSVSCCRFGGHRV